MALLLTTRKSLATIVFVGLIFLAALTSRAQISTVTVNGVVTDSSGATIPDAKVTVTENATGAQQTAQTDDMGRYTIVNLRPGNYDVQVVATGFATTKHTNEALLVGQTLTLNFALQVASVAQTVEVSAGPEAVPTSQSMVNTVIEPSEIGELPSASRSFSDLAALAPGVTVSGGTSAVSNSGLSVTIGGSTTFQVGWVVDNATAENNFYGGQMSKFAQDWIQEFSLVSQQAPAEYGEAAGGFINAVTRSGGNDVHGRAYSYFQDNALNAAPHFAKAGTKPPYNLERPGGMIGGPIKKDKLFYFIGYEYFRALQSIPSTVPAGFGPGSAPGNYSGVNTSHIGMAKIDWQKSDKDRFTFRYNTEYDFSTNSGLGGTTSWGDASNPVTRHWLPMMSWTRTISPNTINQLTATYGRESEDGSCNYFNLVGPYPGYPTQPGSAPLGDPVNWVAQINYPAAGVVVGCPQSGWAQSHYISWRQAYVSDTLNMNRGAHSVEVGVTPGYQQVWWGGVLTDGTGAFTINGKNPFNPSVSSTYPVADLMNGYGGPAGEKQSSYGPSFSFFAEDSYKVKPTLTLNYGLRYSFDLLNSMFTNNYINPAIKSGVSACNCGPIAAPLNPMHNDFGDLSPRFGFAWTPFHDDGKTVIRGGFGLFYDESHSAVVGFYYGQAIGDAYPIDVNATLASLNPYCYGNPCTSSVPMAYQKYVEEALAYSLATYTIPNFALGTYQMPNGGPTYVIPAPTQTIGGAVQPAPTTSGTIIDDENLKTPGEIQVSAGIGHDFTNSFNVTADYVHIRGFNEYILRNTNVSMAGTLLNPVYGSIKGLGNGGILDDDSLRIVGSYKNRRGDIARVAYTLDRSYNNSYGSFGAATSTSLATNPFNYNVDWGPSGIPLNTLTFNGSVHTPLGLVFAPLFLFSSAPPFQATTTAAVPGCPAYYNQCYPIGYGRNSLRGGYTYMLNARLSKKFRVKESKSVTLYFEGYNLLNHPNYGTDFQNSVLSSSFLQPNNTVTTMRLLQVGAQFDF